MTQKEISKQLGFCDNTIKRYRADLIMDRPYNRKKTTENETHTSGGNTENIKNTESN